MDKKLFADNIIYLLSIHSSIYISIFLCFFLFIFLYVYIYYTEGVVWEARISIRWAALLLLFLVLWLLYIRLIKAIVATNKTTPTMEDMVAMTISPPGRELEEDPDSSLRTPISIVENDCQS